jgi:hypothetical protein
MKIINVTGNPEPKEREEVFYILITHDEYEERDFYDKRSFNLPWGGLEMYGSEEEALDGVEGPLYVIRCEVVAKTI